ncbi:hypothetical protein [Rhodoferax sp. WC2427]|uniref:hypothetical protein n=1 Tax=Rhodoferax sp. WC2427 TaxID=3234144 RepID=UPI00346754C1
MFFYVYPLRINGLRLTQLTVQTHAPVYGRLVLRKPSHDHFGPDALCASLYDKESKEVLPELVNAKVAKINVGMHLTGYEQHGRGRKGRIDRHPQSWLCALTPADLTLLVQMIPPRRSGGSGFDPEDDDRA